MNFRRLWGLIPILLLPCVMAARRPPAKVEDLFVGEYRLSAPTSVGGGRYGLPDGGFVVISEKDTGRLLYWVQLYQIEYVGSLEKDVQRYYIKKMAAVGDVVVIWDELGGRYALLLDERKPVLLSSKRATDFTGLVGTEFKK